MPDIGSRVRYVLVLDMPNIESSVRYARYSVEVSYMPNIGSGVR